jgi:hypothetical protein
LSHPPFFLIVTFTTHHRLLSRGCCPSAFPNLQPPHPLSSLYAIKCSHPPFFLYVMLTLTDALLSLSHTSRKTSSISLFHNISGQSSFTDF